VRTILAHDSWARADTNKADVTILAGSTHAA
jgi:hypothetical protein